MKLLVAIDLSAASTRVIEVARQVALATHAHVYVLHVAEPEPDFVGFEAGPGVVRDQVAEEFRQAHRAVQAFADSLREGGVEASAAGARTNCPDCPDRGRAAGGRSHHCRQPWP